MVALFLLKGVHMPGDNTVGSTKASDTSARARYTASITRNSLRKISRAVGCPNVGG